MELLYNSDKNPPNKNREECTVILSKDANIHYPFCHNNALRQKLKDKIDSAELSEKKANKKKALKNIIIYILGDEWPSSKREREIYNIFVRDKKMQISGKYLKFCDCIIVLVGEKEIDELQILVVE